MNVKVMKYNIHNGAIRWQVLKSIKVLFRILHSHPPFQRFILFIYLFQQSMLQ